MGANQKLSILEGVKRVFGDFYGHSCNLLPRRQLFCIGHESQFHTVSESNIIFGWFFLIFHLLNGRVSQLLVELYRINFKRSKWSRIKLSINLKQFAILERKKKAKFRFFPRILGHTKSSLVASLINNRSHPVYF